MVTKLVKLIHREISGIHYAAYILGVFALSSQVLGLIRDRLLAHTFGAGTTLDLYYAAFRVPDLLFLTIASVVSISVLIPFFVERQERSREESKQLLDTVFSFFFVVITAACAIAFLLMPIITPVLFPGFSTEELATTTRLSRYLLLSPILLGISNLFATVTQAYQRFVLHALSPLVYNLGIIVGVIALVPVYGITGVVYGVLLGAAAHLAVQLPFIIRRGYLPRLMWQWNGPVLRRVVLHSAPRRIALSIHHIAIIALLSMASLMSDGSIAVFQFGFNLQSVTLSLVGASYSVAAFPALTRMFSRGETERFVRYVTSAARHIVFWALPLAALFIVLRAQIVRTVLGSGRFDWQDTQLTAAVMALFVVSLVFQSVMLLFVRGYYAAGNTRTPFVVNMITGGVMIATAAAFWYLYAHVPVFASTVTELFRVSGIPGAEVLMLPLGYSIAFIGNGCVLWVLFRRDFQVRHRGIVSSFITSILGALVTGVGAYAGLNIFDDLLPLTALWGVFLQGAAAGVLGIGCGVTALALARSRELSELIRALRRRIGTRPVVTSESDTLE